MSSRSFRPAMRDLKTAAPFCWTLDRKDIVTLFPMIESLHGNAEIYTLGDAARQFEEQGFLGPISILSSSECRQFMAGLNGFFGKPCLDWGKSRAVSSRAFFDLAHHPRIIDTLTPLLGHNFMLWGAIVVSRGPGARHPWHSDIESSTCGGKTASVWIGLENTTRDSSLLLIPRTHLIGVTIQEIEFQNGQGRIDTTDANVLRWAQERDSRSQFVKPDMLDGDALFFDGRLWHGSNNRFTGIRRALLLQYATPDAVVRMPDESSFEWPFRYLKIPRPPCIMVQGQGNPAVNRFVTGPLPEDGVEGCELRSRIHPLHVPLPPPDDGKWKMFRIFNGATAHLQHLTCHASTLSPGRSPHPPHQHSEEELLLLLAGEVDLLLPDATPAVQGDRLRLKAGEFVYYPAQFSHTLKSVGVVPANYLMFKWHNHQSVDAADAPLDFDRWPLVQGAKDAANEPGFHPRVLFNKPTRWLRKLHCHTTTLAPDAGYNPHVDAYDVAIVVLEGEIETLGERARPYDVIFYPAGEPHGMHNPGSEPARYVVFEFHGRVHPIPATSGRGKIVLFEKLVDLRRWKRRVQNLTLRLRKGK